ncbi:adenylate kinase [Halohasta litchfieldiae]|jgi:adenylate kinase|uniref:Adenylate kinase n=1 Tax=Halohasta litchfieldiae TaxID=1073996 RepID=A0A1H6RUI5_9EURY|nr:adenylate kinase [Halohasta litchfieldiae]ATW89633.1 adenylate kinase [Halohasta litchfieldiae]SEI55205.1 Adenylate kinase [Halohasta litchfieldiae]
MSKRILLLGAPGAGKGTQSKRLAEEYGIEHITTGDALRANKDMETEHGTPREYMDAGDLVPDAVVNEIVDAALADADGFVLDGYPRNLSQAEYLSEQTDLTAALFLDVGEDELIRRLTGRRMDPETGDIYHTEFNMPDDEEIEARLVQRDDDTEEVVKDRLETYYDNTEPVIDHYREQGALVEVDGEAHPDEVFERITDVVESEA